MLLKHIIDENCVKFFSCESWVFLGTLNKDCEKGHLNRIIKKSINWWSAILGGKEKMLKESDNRTFPPWWLLMYQMYLKR